MKSFLKEYKILIKIIPIKIEPKVLPLNKYKKPWKYNVINYDIDYLNKKPNKIPFDYEIFSK